jgi:hypothetical protein
MTPIESQIKDKNNPKEETEQTFATAGILIAALVGQAIQQNNGAFSPAAIFLVAIAILVSIVSLFNLNFCKKISLHEHIIPILAIILLIQFIQLLTFSPGIYIQGTEQAWLIFNSVGVLAAFLTATCLSKDPLFGRLGFALLFTTFVLLCVWILRTSPDPKIDVFYFQKDSVAKLLKFENPYSSVFSNIYGHSHFYGLGLVKDGILQFGYPYLPLDLIIAIPSYLLGDIRISQVVAIGLSGLIFAKLQPGPLGRGLAALYWFSPRSLFVIEQAWIEPLIVFFAAVMVFLLKKFPKSAGWTAGLLLASKQTMIWMPFLLPLLFVGKSKKWWQPLFIAMTFATLTCLPFFLWNPSAFWKSSVALQFVQPFRPDALSFPALFYQIGLTGIHWSIAFPMSMACIAVSYWKLPRTIAGWAMAVCLTYIVFFAFNKQAFCNYYFMIIGFACLAAASTHFDQAEMRALNFGKKGKR